MDQLPNKIETKTSPFSLPKSTTNSIQNRNVTKMKYSTGGESKFFYLSVSVFVLVASGALIYVLLSLSQLQKLSTVSTNNTTTSYTTNNTVQVSDSETVTQTPWAAREIKINNNIVWKLQLPASFIETTVGAADGVNIFNGSDSGNDYKLLLAFPLFTNYPDGEPQDLKAWVQKELSFLTAEESLTIKSESFNLNNNVQATLLVNTREITGDSGSARTYGTKKALVLYISKTKTRNFSKITLIPQGAYNEETAKAVLERVASSIKF